MEPLEGPYEIFELTDGESFTCKISSFQVGQVEIHPAYQPAGKMITALRIDLPIDYKPLFPFYFDITSQTLIAQLLPFLEAPGFAQKLYKITKYGVAPKARFSLQVS